MIIKCIILYNRRAKYIVYLIILYEYIYSQHKNTDAILCQRYRLRSLKTKDEDGVVTSLQ
jgi:hypothetical protein